jgi:hypothetical protein
MGQIQASVPSYLYTCVLAPFSCSFVPIKATMMDVMFLPMCAHLYRDLCVYPWPVNIITIMNIQFYVTFKFLFVYRRLTLLSLKSLFSGFDCLVRCCGIRPRPI